MPESLSISPARADDPRAAPLIAALDAYLVGLYPAESNHLLSVAELLRPNVTFLLALQGSAAVGCGAVRIDAEYGEIKRMFVLPASRGQRLGQRLLEQLEETIRQQRVPLARLETGVAQPEAIRLYARCGYRRIPPFGSYRADPLSLFFEKKL